MKNNEKYYGWVVEWIETESGWGQRPDGFAVYLTEELAIKGTKERTQKQKEYFDKVIGPNQVPYEYSFPANNGKAVLTKVSKEVYDKIKKYTLYINRLTELNPRKK